MIQRGPQYLPKLMVQGGIRLVLIAALPMLAARNLAYWQAWVFLGIATVQLIYALWLFREIRLVQSVALHDLEHPGHTFADLPHQACDDQNTDDERIARSMAARALT